MFYPSADDRLSMSYVVSVHSDEIEVSIVNQIIIDWFKSNDEQFSQIRIRLSEFMKKFILKRINLKF